MKVAHAVVGNVQNADIELQIVNALAAWRVTQGIYNFDCDLALAIIDTPIKELPIDVFYCLPEWCVYIKSSKLRLDENLLSGFFVFLEYDSDFDRTELRFLLDYEDKGIMALSIPLDQPTIDETIFLDNLPLHIAAIVKPILNLTLYLCANNADYGDRPPPTLPRPKRTKQGWRLFAPDRPTTWEVGLQTGVINDSCETRPRPQVGHANWCVAYTDAGKTKCILKWLTL